MLESLVHEVEAADQELTRLRNKIQSRLIFLLLVTFKKLSRIRKIKPHMIGFLFIILKIADKKKVTEGTEKHRTMFYSVCCLNNETPFSAILLPAHSLYYSANA